MAPKTKKIVLKQILSDAAPELTMSASPPDPIELTDYKGNFIGRVAGTTRPTAVPSSIDCKYIVKEGIVCYKVVQTQNTVHHPIGAILTKEEVESLMSRTSSYTVVVK